MPQCPEQSRTADEIIPTFITSMKVSIHDNKVAAYAEADSQQRQGWTIVSISEVTTLVTWSYSKAPTKPKTRTADGVVWAVVLQR